MRCIRQSYYFWEAIRIRYDGRRHGDRIEMESFNLNSNNRLELLLTLRELPRQICEHEDGEGEVVKRCQRLGERS